MPGEVVVPVAVARAVVNSQWAATVPPDASASQKQIYARYAQAVEKVWARKIRYADADHLRQLREPITALLAETQGIFSPTRRAMVAFDELLGDALVSEEAAVAERAERTRRD